MLLVCLQSEAAAVAAKMQQAIDLLMKENEMLTVKAAMADVQKVSPAAACVGGHC